MTKQHALLSASGSHTWINCSGSVEAQANIENKSNPYADEGTLAHELSDICLKADKDTDKYLGTTITASGGTLKTVVDADMVRYIQDYLDYVRSFRSEKFSFFTEERVCFSHVVPNGFGTMDSGLMDHTTNTLHIFDLKYGFGEVSAVKNTQGILYASGFYNELSCIYDIDKIVIHIVQPRIRNYSSWEITIDELKEFEDYIAERARLALTKDAPRTAGPKQCKWCRASAYLIDGKEYFCEEMLKMTKEIENEIDLDNFNDVTKLPELLDKVEVIDAFIKKVQEMALEKVKGGRKIEGYKLIRPSGKSKWSDGASDKLKELLGDKCFKGERPLFGITDMKKIIRTEGIAKGKGVEDIIKPLKFTPEGTLKLVKREAKGEEVLLVEDIFDEV